ncbi:hypothetical protein BJ165DRAFT_1530851 [Panaeolus papilionaceus]|nr:hypothetical protein BJ165DRAFT_1530851 [Panaeolus papilionaceus]
MSGSTSNDFIPPGLFEAQPNNVPVTGEKRQQHMLPLTDPSATSSLSSTTPTNGNPSAARSELDSGAPVVPLAAPLTSAVKPSTFLGGGTLQAGETTTLNHLAGDQPIEGGAHLGPGNLPRTPLLSSGTQGTLAAGETTTTLNQLAGAQPIEFPNTVLGSGTNNHPRTPSFPGAYPGTESPLHYPPVSSIPSMAMNTLQSVNETILNVGEKVGEYVPESVSSYFPHSRKASSDPSYQPEDSASPPTGTLVPDWPREAAKLDQAPTPANVPNLHPGAQAALDDAEYVQDKAIADAYANDITSSNNHSAAASNVDKGQPASFNHEGPHPAPTKLPSFLAGQPLDTNIDLGFLDNSVESQDKPLARALDHKDTTPTRVAEPEWKKTAVFPPGDTRPSQSKGDSGAPRTSSLSSAGISSTTATPGHEVPAANISRIQTHPPAGLSSNKTADVAATSSIPPLTKPRQSTTHTNEVARDTQIDSDQARGPSLDEAAAKPLPNTPGANTHHSPAGVLNGGGAEVRNVAKKEGIEIVPAVPGEHGHMGYAREVKKGDVDPLVRRGDVWDMKLKQDVKKDGDEKDGDHDGSRKLTKPKPKPADSFEMAKEHHGSTTTKGDHAHPSTTTNAPSAVANTAGSSHPQTTPSKLTKNVHAERGTTTHPDIPHYGGDRHLDPNSHVEPPSPKKPGLMDKIKGEMKIVSGKLGGKEEKVEEGRRLMGKLQN